MRITMLALGTRGDADPAMIQRARELGEKIRAEDGLGAAVTVIEAYISGR